MEPKVSLVIPCYNVEKYVSKCLDSALEQTLADIEIICVNDGSTDGTLNILRKYESSDGRIKVIDKPNEGYGATMNKGFQAATGEFLGILESDDFLDSDALEYLYNIAVSNNAEVVKANFYYYWSAPDEQNYNCDLIDKEESEKIIDPHITPHIFFVKPSIWSAIYRRSFIEDNKITFNETPGASYQDASFNFKVWLYSHRVWLTRKAFLHYRQDNESSSVNSPGKVYCVCDEYKVMREALDSYPQRDEAEKLIPILVKMKFDTYMWNYERLAPKLGREFLNTMRDEFALHINSGEIDWSLFDQAKRKRLESIIEDPQFFHMTHQGAAKESDKFATLKRFYTQGGISYVGKLIKFKSQTR